MSDESYGVTLNITLLTLVHQLFHHSVAVFNFSNFQIFQIFTFQIFNHFLDKQVVILF